MPDNDAFWDFYWETRLLPMENLGKRAAILAVSELIRSQAPQAGRALRLLELGCGEGQVIGTLLDAHDQWCSLPASLGVDLKAPSLARCRKDYPGLRCIQGDFTDPTLLAGLGKFDVVLLVNALHEVFSAGFSPERNEIDVPAAKLRVTEALGGAAGCLEAGGWLVLFDGLEPPGDPHRRLRIRFRSSLARENFEIFAQQYHPFRITYRQATDPHCIELSQRDFTRYITKSIFLGKGLWKTERFESYQYFTEAEYRAAFAHQGLEITHLHTLTMNEEKWRRLVEIDTPGFRFPQEHILILARPAQDRLEVQFY
ncbi:MAG: class I SAM-dependent methyltransferase [Chloroflexi bacterium]|nr:class I SAM-dependent methyltransferase [Anaerolineaceae bacterium]NMB90677.1 class I SAM-dependent methyltransferase [Chloroflexota bacterium]